MVPEQYDSLELGARRSEGLVVGSRFAFRTSIIAFDLFSPFLAASFVSWTYLDHFYGTSHRWMEYGLIGIAVGVVFTLANVMVGGYRPANLARLIPSLWHVLLNWIIVWMVLLMIAFSVKLSEDLSRVIVFSLAAVGMLTILGSRVLIAYIAAKSPSLLFHRERVAVLSIGEPLSLSAAFLKRFQVSMTETVTIRDGVVASDIARICNDIVDRGIEQVFVSVADGNLGIAKPLMTDPRLALRAPIALISDGWSAHMSPRIVHFAPGVVALEFVLEPDGVIGQALKRVLDVVIASAALFLLSPLFLLTAIAVRLDSTGPIIFRQRRLGLNDNVFEILKFRSMSVLENGAVVRQARKGDSRVTRVGRIIRATSIDELPQLINVLRGEMSIIGPRPHAIAHDEYYERHIPDYARRRGVKPGLTGWAQVHGYRGETESVQAMADRVAHDLWYIQNWSIRLDISILMRTAIALIRNRNVY